MRWGLVRWWAVALGWVMTCTLSARENSPPPRNDPIRVVATQSGVKQQNRPQTKEEDDRVAILLALRLLADRPNGQVLPPGVRVQIANGEQIVELAPIQRRPPLNDPADSPAAEVLSDEQLLSRVQLDPKDGKGLLEYLRNRTLKENELNQLDHWIQQFGADSFEERLRAVKEVERYGAAAIGRLKATLKHTDPEVRYRAQQALQRLETIPQGQVLAAVVRALQQQKPPGTVPALLEFLPSATDDDNVLSVIRQALISLAATPDGQAEPALVAALQDRHPIRRSMAMIALIEGGPANRRIRLPDAYPQVRDAVRREKDIEVKYTALWTLLLTTRESEYLSELLALIPDLPRGHLWQLEDLLLQLSGGKHPPNGRFGKDPQSLTKTRDAWLQWWKEQGQQLSLADFRYQPRIRGVTEIIEIDIRGYSQGRVVSLGADLKEKWSITGLNYPCDMKRLSNGQILVADTNTSRVLVFDADGRQIRAHFINQQPFAIYVLPNDDIQIIARNNVYLFDKQWKQKAIYSRPAFDIISGCRLPNGETLLVRNVAQGSTGFRLDLQLKELRDTHSFARMNHMQSIEPIDEERVLVCEYNRVAEYNLKTGKLVWSYNCNNPNSAQRLPNGNTLITLMNDPPNGRIIELAPDGEIVWEYQSKDPALRPVRAWRR